MSASAAPPDPIAAYAAAVPDRVAVVEDGTPTTYAELNAEVNRFAHALRALGARAGERLIWCSPNARAVLVTMHTCRKLGLAAVPLSYRLTAPELRFLIDDRITSMSSLDSSRVSASKRRISTCAACPTC